MKKILIIKLSALGDVLRTTPILRVLDGKITWITNRDALPLLKTPKIDNLVDINNKAKIEKIKKEKFDLILSLDEAIQAAKLASEIKTKKLIGVYIENGKITYTNDSKSWFDMSLISRLGIKKANELKKNNELSYQEHLFKMLSKKFNGEEYVLNIKPKKINQTIIGIEKRVGEKWPAKQWAYYDKLIEKLKIQNSKLKIKIFRQRKNLVDYIKDINNCSIIVCGDTLAMHIGLILKKKVVALFTCTSPQEIYDYGRTTKIASPLWKKYFYTREFNTQLSQSISVEQVYNAIKGKEIYNFA